MLGRADGADLYRGGAVVPRVPALMRDRFLPAVKALLITLYFSAAFWKLTTGFLDPRVFVRGHARRRAFCRIVRRPRARFIIIRPRFVGVGAGADVRPEFLVPTLLLAKHRSAVPVALLFHFLINLMPVTYAGGFSIAMCCRLVLFLPGSLRPRMMNRRGPRPGARACRWRWQHYYIYTRTGRPSTRPACSSWGSAGPMYRERSLKNHLKLPGPPT